MNDAYDEAELQHRIERQQRVVARLLGERRRTCEADEALYRLCQRLAKLRYQRQFRSGTISSGGSPQR
ncbi:MAG: hypothetical protein HC869_20745 [Rhodospirillales bacterium]|nr:hypothetical protein [Rhodospirillales bacterium]